MVYSESSPLDDINVIQL